MDTVHELYLKIKQQKLYHKSLFVIIIFIYLPRFQLRQSSKNNGALAQLARVLDWQSRGHRFDSGMLHQKNQRVTNIFCDSFFVYAQKITSGKD